MIVNRFPWNVTASGGARQDYLAPWDPQWNTRGEVGFYYDTQLGRLGNPGFLAKIGSFGQRVKAKLGLGSMPTEFEIARGCQMPYTPAMSSWIATKEGYVTQPWPRGDNYAPSVAQPGWPAMLGEADPMTQPATPATVEDVVSLMNAHNDRVFALSLISTTAVAVSAFLTVFHTIKRILQEK